MMRTKPKPSSANIAGLMMEMDALLHPYQSDNDLKSVDAFINKLSQYDWKDPMDARALKFMINMKKLTGEHAGKSLLHFIATPYPNSNKLSYNVGEKINQTDQMGLIATLTSLYGADLLAKDRNGTTVLQQNGDVLESIALLGKKELDKFLKANNIQLSDQDNRQLKAAVMRRASPQVLRKKKKVLKAKLKGEELNEKKPNPFESFIRSAAQAKSLLMGESKPSNKLSQKNMESIISLHHDKENGLLHESMEPLTINFVFAQMKRPDSTVSLLDNRKKAAPIIQDIAESVQFLVRNKEDPNQENENRLRAALKKMKDDKVKAHPTPLFSDADIDKIVAQLKSYAVLERPLNRQDYLNMMSAIIKIPAKIGLNLFAFTKNDEQAPDYDRDNRLLMNFEAMLNDRHSSSFSQGVKAIKNYGVSTFFKAIKHKEHGLLDMDIIKKNDDLLRIYYIANASTAASPSQIAHAQYLYARYSKERAKMAEYYGYNELYHGDQGYQANYMHYLLRAKNAQDPEALLEVATILTNSQRKEEAVAVLKQLLTQQTGDPSSQTIPEKVETNRIIKAKLDAENLIRKDPVLSKREDLKIRIEARMVEVPKMREPTEEEKNQVFNSSPLSRR